jgi:hypothetical protein
MHNRAHHDAAGGHGVTAEQLNSSSYPLLDRTDANQPCDITYSMIASLESGDAGETLTSRICGNITMHDLRAAPQIST